MADLHPESIDVEWSVDAGLRRESAGELHLRDNLRECFRDAFRMVGYCVAGAYSGASIASSVGYINTRLASFGARSE